MRQLILFGLCLGLFGCDSVDIVAGRTCLEGDPSLVLGTGETEWRDLSEEASITMVHGPQGGWHILTSLRLVEMGVIVNIVTQLTDISSGVEISHNQYTLQSTPNNDCFAEIVGLYSYLDVSALADEDNHTPPALLDGHELALEVSVTASDGLVLEESLVLIAVLDPADVL
jgi:hypothetical protein